MQILVSDPIARQGIEILQSAARVDVHPQIGADMLQAVIPDYDALIVRSRTQVSAPLIHAGTRLRVIGRAGVGTDNIDMDAASARGVAVVNSPTSVTISVAEHTLALMLAVARFIPQADASLKQGEWNKQKFMGTELNGKTLGIIGLGRIGTQVALRAHAFGMYVVAFDPYITRVRAMVCGARLADSLEELLGESDFVSIHTPLLPTTRGMFGRAELDKMKPNARLIFCARGGVVDERALLEALDQGRIVGAALDVFENEPPGANPILHHPRIVVTPHLGAQTEDAQTKAAIEMAEQVVKILSQ
ncbi:MAG: phosphoglycerate dehydrogenase [Anaerolineae bacterium]|nr:phosphoglycerate dehydrogenase [Anaerolineae bacterium]